MFVQKTIGMKSLTAFLWCFFAMATLYAQVPEVWVFGKNAGLDFSSGNPVPGTFEIDNCYSQTSSQCDEAGNLLFYCDGRNIKDRTGTIMPGSENPVWPSVHIGTRIFSSIIPMEWDTTKYFVFMLTPSSGKPPFGIYYDGVLSYSVVDMQLNNGLGGVDTTYRNILLDIDLDAKGLLTVPGADCGYWVIVCKANSPTGKFKAYRITDDHVSENPVLSDIDLPDYQYAFNNMRMVYAYKYHKIIVCLGARIMAVMDFDPATGRLSNGHKILDLAEFRNEGGGAAFPSFCLSPNEKFIYLLGYPNAGVTPNGPAIRLRQYPVNLANNAPTLTSSEIIFQTNDAIYQIPSTSLPYYSQNCDIRLGPDKKVYLFYNTGMSFLGVINQPDAAGLACDFVPKGLFLNSETFGSYYFPPPENKRIKREISHIRHDTTLCLREPLTLSPQIKPEDYNSFMWDDGSHALYRTVQGAGIYWVTSTGACSLRERTDTFHIQLEDAAVCNCQIFLPNAFSPNGDGINDQFRPILPVSCIRKGYRMEIFNRWGQLVFRTYNPLEGWDGLQRNQTADAGVYFYYVGYIDYWNSEQNLKGSLTLLH